CCLSSGWAVNLACFPVFRHRSSGKDDVRFCEQPLQGSVAVRMCRIFIPDDGFERLLDVRCPQRMIAVMAKQGSDRMLGSLKQKGLSADRPRYGGHMQAAAVGNHLHRAVAQ